jgi:hypothetical protein
MFDFLLGAIAGGMPNKAFAVVFGSFMLVAAIAALFVWMVIR